MQPPFDRYYNKICCHFVGALSERQNNDLQNKTGAHCAPIQKRRTFGFALIMH